METFRSRLQALLDEKNINGADLARETRIAKGTIYRYLRGEKERPIPAHCLLIAGFFGVNADWLNSGSGPKKTNDRSDYWEEKVRNLEERISFYEQMIRDKEEIVSYLRDKVKNYETRKKE